MQTQFVVHMRGAHQIASGHKTPLPWRLDPVRSTWSLSDSRSSPIRFQVFKIRGKMKGDMHGEVKV